MRIQLAKTYDDIIGCDNLLAAWGEFCRGKRQKPDVQLFGRRLIDNILQLHLELANESYCHSGYQHFSISDPKPRNIHKASVRDRLLHHALYRQLYPFFDRTFIADSFSCRLGKGTYKALQQFQRMAWQVNQNNTRTCWVLKCDIRKFFANIDHAILQQILAQYIPNQKILALLNGVIESFSIVPSVGLPLGNLTSQLLVNVYMNEFDQFVKHRLKARYYIRYADDFVFLDHDRDQLVALIRPIEQFLHEKLRLNLHPDKVWVKTLASGVDWLGWIHFPHHRVLRTATKRRMMQRIKEHGTPETVQSYRGLLQHGNSYKLQTEVSNQAWLWQ